MSSLMWIMLGNLVVWGLIVWLMTRLAAGERDLSDGLSRLEKRLDDR